MNAAYFGLGLMEIVILAALGVMLLIGIVAVTAIVLASQRRR